jgi:hypothetical protein
MLSEFVKLLERGVSFEVRETFDFVIVKAEILDEVGTFGFKIFDELKTTSRRDSFELTLESAGNNTSILDTSQDSYNALKSHLEEFSNESLEVNLRINKQCVDGLLTVYFLREFSLFIESLSFVDVIKEFSAKVCPRLLLEVQEAICDFGSDSIYFVSSEKLKYLDLCPEPDVIERRAQRINLFNENSHANNIKVVLTPEDFDFKGNASVSSIKGVADTIKAKLSLLFLANVSDFNREDISSLKIYGYKTVSLTDEHIGEFQRQHTLTYKVYNWIYSGGNCSDKIGLVRNLVSIQVNKSESFEIDLNLWNAIQSNYQIYLKGNINSYLEVKNRIGEVIIDATSKTYDMANDLMSAFRNNVAILLTFFISVILVNGIKDLGPSNIFSYTYLFIVGVISVSSLLWLYFQKSSIQRQYDSLTKTVIKTIHLSYDKIMLKDEIDECVDPIVGSNKDSLDVQLKNVSKWWWGIILFFFISFLLATLYKKDVISISTLQALKQPPISSGNKQSSP